MLIRTLLLALLLTCQPLHAQQILRSSVSPEFIDGLHYKYLRFLATELNAELVITPMPFARRVQALRNGELDVMVGIQYGHANKDDIVYLQPAYEELSHNYFVLNERQDNLISSASLHGLIMAVTINASYVKELRDIPRVDLVGGKQIFRCNGMIDREG